MKCQSLFSGENIIILSFAELVRRVVIDIVITKPILHLLNFFPSCQEYIQ